MRRRLLTRLFLLIVFAFAGFLVVAWLTRTTHRINRYSFAEIRAGMSKDAVEALLNCSPGEYGASPLRRVGSVISLEQLQTVLDNVNQSGAGGGGRTSHIWAGNEGAILVHFNERNVVTDAFFFEVESLGVKATVQRWLGRTGLSS